MEYINLLLHSTNLYWVFRVSLKFIGWCFAKVASNCMKLYCLFGAMTNSKIMPCRVIATILKSCMGCCGNTSVSNWSNSWEVFQSGVKWDVENKRILTFKTDYELCNEQKSLTEGTTRKKARSRGSMMYKGAVRMNSKCIVYLYLSLWKRY